MLHVCRHIRKTNETIRMFPVETMDQAIESVKQLQFDDIARFGNTARYRIEDDNGNIVTCFFKLRLGQRDTNLEQNIRKGTAK